MHALQRYKIIQDAGKVIKMEIWDPAGSERYRSLVQTFFRGLHGVIYAYDITDRASYDSLKSYWIEHLASKQVIRQDVLKLLVGNKSDLAPSKRAVPFEEAQVGRNGDRAKRQQLWLVTLWPLLVTLCHSPSTSQPPLSCLAFLDWPPSPTAPMYSVLSTGWRQLCSRCQRRRCAPARLGRVQVLSGKSGPSRPRLCALQVLTLENFSSESAKGIYAQRNLQD